VRAILLLLLILLSCKKEEFDSNLLSLLKNSSSPFRIWKTSPERDLVLGTRRPLVEFHFSEPIQDSICRRSLRFSGKGEYRVESDSQVIRWVSQSDLEPGTHQLFLDAQCESKEGKNLRENFQWSFTIPEPLKPVPEPIPIPDPIPTPKAIAFGVQSDGCLGEITSASNCFWIKDEVRKKSSEYLFKGGDQGLGSFGSTLDCNDSTTDNFSITFDMGIPIGEIWEKTRLDRLGLPSSTIRLANVIPYFCNSESMTICRQFVLVFAEQEASCNGTAFGRSGDFNLSTFYATSPILYRLTILKDLKSEKNTILTEDWKFWMEGKP